MGELLTMTYDKVFNLPSLNLRFFMVYGPRQPRAGAYAIVTGKFIEQAARNESLTIEGSGEQFRDFIHVSDVVKGLIQAYRSDVRGVTLNIGSGRKHTVKEVADLISSNQIHVKERPHDLKGTLANITLAENLLGFAATKDFRTEMSKLIKAGPRDHLSPFWNEPDTLTKIEFLIPGFLNMTLSEQDHRIRNYGIEQFLDSLFDE